MQRFVLTVVSAMYPTSPVPLTLPFRKLNWIDNSGISALGVHVPRRPVAVAERVDAPPRLEGVKASAFPAVPTPFQRV